MRQPHRLPVCIVLLVLSAALNLAGAARAELRSSEHFYSKGSVHDGPFGSRFPSTQLVDPDLYVAAVLSNRAYHAGCDGTIPIPDFVLEHQSVSMSDWTYVTQFRPVSGHYDFAVCLWKNPSAKHAIIAFQGTTGLSAWLNNILGWVLMHQQPAFLLANLFVDHNEALAELRNERYSFSFTGHSLGAGLAELSACHYNVTSIGFDSPGIKKLLPTPDSDSSDACARHLAAGWDGELSVRTILSRNPNPVHVIGGQVGRLAYSNQYARALNDSWWPMYYIYAMMAYSSTWLPIALWVLVVHTFCLQPSITMGLPMYIVSHDEMGTTMLCILTVSKFLPKAWEMAGIDIAMTDLSPLFPFMFCCYLWLVVETTHRRNWAGSLWCGTSKFTSWTARIFFALDRINYIFVETLAHLVVVRLALERRDKLQIVQKCFQFGLIFAEASIMSGLCGGHESSLFWLIGVFLFHRGCEMFRRFPLSPQLWNAPSSVARVSATCLALFLYTLPPVTLYGYMVKEFEHSMDNYHYSITHHRADRPLISHRGLSSREASMKNFVFEQLSLWLVTASPVLCGRGFYDVLRQAGMGKGWALGCFVLFVSGSIWVYMCVFPTY